MRFVRHRREHFIRIAEFCGGFENFRMVEQCAIEHSMLVDHEPIVDIGGNSLGLLAAESLKAAVREGREPRIRPGWSLPVRAALGTLACIRHGLLR